MTVVSIANFHKRNYSTNYPQIWRKTLYAKIFFLIFMDSLLKNDEVKICVLYELSEGGSFTASMLAGKTGFKYETIHKSLLFLQKLDIIKLTSIPHGEKNYVYYELTEMGRTVVNNADLSKQNLEKRV